MVRKVLLVVSVAFGAALFVQCGTPKGSCTASSCPNGCCDSTGTCAAGSTATACGKAGAACVACTSAQSCTAQACVMTGTGGAGNTGGGSGGGSGNTGGGTSSTGGGTSTGGGSGMSCDITAPSCGANQVCLISSNNGMTASCFSGCDPAAQDCGGGKKCTYVQNGMALGRACVDAGTAAEGATCTQDGAGDNCAAGLLCTTPDNKCTQFCNLSGATCSAGHSCSGILSVMNGEFPLICEPGCSLLTQECMSGQGCLPAAGGGTVCVTVGTLDAGVACVNPVDCAKGSACVDTGMKKCLPFCNLDGGSPHCTSGACTSSMPALPEGAGFCL